MAHSNVNGRPEPEVIVNFQDGYSYSKNKMEEFFRSGPFEKPAKVKESHPPLKKDDVDLIVRELEIPRAQAERALIDNEADVTKALLALIQP